MIRVSVDTYVIGRESAGEEASRRQAFFEFHSGKSVLITKRPCLRTCMFRLHWSWPRCSTVNRAIPPICYTRVGYLSHGNQFPSLFYAKKTQTFPFVLLPLPLTVSLTESSANIEIDTGNDNSEFVLSPHFHFRHFCYKTEWQLSLCCRLCL